MYKKTFKAKDGTKVLFREPRLSDAKNAMDHINSFVNEKRSGININKKMDLKGEKDWLKGVISGIKKKQKVMLVVEYNGKYAGNCGIDRKIWKENHKASFGVGIGKEIRNKGIGTLLMKETINLAKKRMKGLEIIVLTVMDYNKIAKNIYKKIGFKKVGKLPDAVKEGKEYINEDVLYLYLK